GSEGALAFASPPPPPLPANQPLDFDPRGADLQITQGADCAAPVVFEGTFPGDPQPPCDPAIPTDLARLFTANLLLNPTGAVDLGPFPLADASFNVNADCSGIFTTTLSGVPAGLYTLCADGVARGTFNTFGEAFYDHGFYNIGVRPTLEDL